VIGTYLTRPTDDAVTENFYNKTRPFGAWRRFKERLAEPQQAAITRENRNDIIASMLAVPGQFFLYFIPVTFMLKDWTAGWISTAALAVCAVGLYFFWYRPLPRD
jgi:solute:Na+ symporter, SSS family